MVTSSPGWLDFMQFARRSLLFRDVGVLLWIEEQIEH
jgi:hypothetical protein